MKRRSFLKASSVAAIAMAFTGNVAAKVLKPVMPSAAKWIDDRTGCLYIILGDGYEFIIRRKRENLQKFFIYNAIGIYDFSWGVWVKEFCTDIYDPATGEYWKIRDKSEARTEFSDVPLMDYPALAKAGIMFDRGEENGPAIRYMFDQGAYIKRMEPVWKDRLGKAIAAGARA